MADPRSRRHPPSSQPQPPSPSRTATRATERTAAQRDGVVIRSSLAPVVVLVLVGGIGATLAQVGSTDVVARLLSIALLTESLTALLLATLLVSARRRAREALARLDRVEGRALEEMRAEGARKRLAAILEATTDFVATADVDGQLLYINGAGRHALGLSDQEDIRAINLVDMCPGWMRSMLLEEGLPAAKRDGAWSFESALVSRDGREIPVSQVILAHRSEQGQVEFLSTVARDISERKRLEAQLVYLASRDSLTDLYNRRRFEEELERLLAMSRRFDTHGALLFLDLDGFKEINDTLGHRVGDELLRSLASVLRDRLRETDVLGRLGGDEFAVLLPQADGPQAQMTTERLLDAVRRHRFSVQGQVIRVTTSAGIALFPKHGTTSEELLAHADQAMYRAKQNRDRFAIYTPEHEHHGAVVSRSVWQLRTREALEKDLLLLYAQPILDLRGRVSQYELLIRLAGDDGEVILPSALLGIAEQSSVIHTIDRWVVQRAIRLIAAEHAAGRRLCLEVNLSARAFADRELLPLLKRELVRSGADPASLVLEITETAAIADMSQARRFITTLKRLGCRFAIDDFGAGFSSFYYLKHLPVDYVKIDGSFIHDLPRNPVDQHLVRAIVEVARGLNIRTIAEYVGDEETVRLLRDYGVDYAQGYHIGRPQPVEEILSGLVPERQLVAS